MSTRGIYAGSDPASKNPTETDTTGRAGLGSFWQLLLLEKYCFADVLPFRQRANLAKLPLNSTLEKQFSILEFGQDEKEHTLEGAREQQQSVSVHWSR